MLRKRSQDLEFSKIRRDLPHKKREVDFSTSPKAGRSILIIFILSIEFPAEN